MVETRRLAGTRHKKTTPPILSHEFIIQNHGDIMSCILMVFIIGLMFPLTSGIASIFIAPQYNETTTLTVDNTSFELYGYQNGFYDIAAIFFYTIAWVVVHAIIQEYVLDKLQRKAHLSKSSTFKFTESGHMLVFALYSIGHAALLLSDLIKTFADLKKIYIGYPEEHKWMSASYKMFFILQISYWLHQFPEFYFQKLRREEMQQKAFVSVLFIGFISAGYTMNFTRVTLVLLVIEYVSQALFHFTRITHFLDKKHISKPLFKAWNILFIIARVASSVIGVTTFWYGLRQNETHQIEIGNGNFNTTFVRLNSLIFLIILQLGRFYSFLSFHLSKFREGGKKKEKKQAAAPAQPKKKKGDESQSEGETVDAKTAKKKN